jgi:hypothetical protein
VLALAVYLLVNTFSGSPRIFPGGRQASQFTKALKRSFDCEDGRRRLSLLGLSIKDIGSHSLRKGASTYALNGSAGGGPSSIAVLLRGEWSLGNVHQRYWKAEAASDCLVGRILAGLPLSECNFGDLPPHFDPEPADRPRVDSALQRALLSCFSSIVLEQRTTGGVLRGCLASLLHHKDFVARQFGSVCQPGDHHYAYNRREQMLFSPLFTDPRAPSFQVLTACLRFGSTASSAMRPTGIPIQTILLREISEVTARIGEVNTTISRGHAEMVSSVSQSVTLGVTSSLSDELRRLGLFGQTVSVAGLQQALETYDQRVQSHLQLLVAEVQRIRSAECASTSPSSSSSSSSSTSSSSPTTAGDAASSPSSRQVFRWSSDQELHLYPESFCLPNETTYEAWKLWHFGTANLPPFSGVHGRDLRTRADRDRLSSWRTVMLHVDNLAHGESSWQQLTDSTLPIPERLSALHSLYTDVVVPQMPEIDESVAEGSYRKRKTQRKITWIARLLRKRKRQFGVSPSAPTTRDSQADAEDAEAARPRRSARTAR